MKRAGAVDDEEMDDGGCGVALDRMGTGRRAETITCV